MLEHVRDPQIRLEILIQRDWLYWMLRTSINIDQHLSFQRPKIGT